MIKIIGDYKMNYKKGLLAFCMVMCLLLTVSSVAASDATIAGEDQSDNMEIDNQQLAAGKVTDEEIISSSDEDILNAQDNGTFTALQNKINNAKEGSTITLENDYYYDDGFSINGIKISKSLTIEGNTHIINANSKSRIFQVSSGDVIFRGIVFTNGKTTDEGYGGAIYGGTAINCTFDSNNAYNGGAIYGGTAINCTFNWNSANAGGATYDTFAMNCKFNNNIAEMEGGAMQNKKATNCVFIGNYAKEHHGGAIVGEAENCIFENCYTLDGSGGAVRCSEGSVVNCTFKNCRATGGDGGAILGTTGIVGCNVVNCSFEKCSAEFGGGAIYLASVVNCSFKNCSAGDYGGALYQCMVKNCTFENCTPQDMYDMNPNLTVSVNSYVNEGETAIVNISIDEAVKGSISVSLDKNNIDVEFSHGFASIPFDNLSTGSHSVEVDFSGDRIYSQYYKKATFRVRADPKLSVNITNIDKSQALLNISAIYDVSFTIDVTVGNKSSSVDMVKGKASLYLDNLNIGDNITVKYAGNGYYMPCSQNVIFEGEADDNTTPPVPVTYPVKVTASDLSMLYSSSSVFKVTVYGTDGKLASDTQVVIKVGGKTVATVKTNANGVATYKPTQTPGTYKISATALGKTITKTLTVKHVVTLKTATVKKSAKKLVIQATLAKVNGKVLKNKKVTFKFNGKKYTAKTNAKGVAKVTIKSNVLKKLKVGKKVTYQATYLKDTVKKSVKIKK